MIWVGWRQQRLEVLIAAGMLVLLAAALVPTGIHMASAYHHDGIAACLGAQPSPECPALLDAFSSRFQQLGNLLGWLTLLPGLIGVLLAAPFVLQLENGGYRLDWTQSITRGRWIVTKLGLAIGAAVLASLAYVELVTWWRAPLTSIHGRMDPSVFDSEGVVVLGYTLFALALALVIGVVWRRAVAALVVGFVGYFVARLFVDTWLRLRLTPAQTGTWPAHGREPAALARAWVLSERPSTRTGGHLQGRCLHLGGDVKRCVLEGPAYMHAVYEPAGRFWHMQAVEVALFGGVALVLIALAGWWTHRRAA